MERHLIALDLDGTILDDHITLNKDIKDTVHKLTELGHVVVISTGRSFRSSRDFYNELGMRTIISNYNGSYVHNPLDETFEPMIATMDQNIVKEIIKRVKPYVQNAYCEYLDHIYIYETNESIEKYIVNNDLCQLHVGDLETILDVDPSSFCTLNLFKDNQAITDILDEYEDMFAYRIWDDYEPAFLEIHNKHINKGYSLMKIAEYYEIDPQNTIAIGDGHNDIEMIMQAGVGVALGNAKQPVKDIANVVLDELHHEGAVSKFLLNHFHL